MIGNYWGSFGYWLNTNHNAVAFGTIIAIAQAVFASAGVFIALYVPWRQARESRQLKQADEARQLKTLRVGLRVEVGITSRQCLDAARLFKAHESTALPQSASMPPLTFFEANASQIATLTIDQLVSLLCFSGTLADLRYFVAGLKPSWRTELNDRKKIAELLTAACTHAGSFLRAIKYDPEGLHWSTELAYEDLIEELRREVSRHVQE